MGKLSAVYAVLADTLSYPAPGHLQALEKGSAALEPGVEKTAIMGFLEKIRSLSLGEWEELHTRTLDLNPPIAPYIGFQTWGESYQRGTFLSKMNRALMESGIDLEGELPDHLIPVLRYLGQVAAPLPELAEVFPEAVKRMQAGLRKAEPGNPYLSILEAVQELAQNLNREAI